MRRLSGICENFANRTPLPVRSKQKIDPTFRLIVVGTPRDELRLAGLAAEPSAEISVTSKSKSASAESAAT